MDSIQNFKVTAGNVLLKVLPFKANTIGGMEASIEKRKPHDEGEVLSVGADDGLFKRDKLVSIGSKFIIPVTQKQEFKGPDGQLYVVIYHRDLKICTYDATEDN